jgi:transposase
MEKYLSCDEVAEMYGVKKITVWQWSGAFLFI